MVELLNLQVCIPKFASLNPQIRKPQWKFIIFAADFNLIINHITLNIYEKEFSSLWECHE